MAKSSTCLDIRGNVTSTTFWTSARSDPNSIHCAPKSMIFFYCKRRRESSSRLFSQPLYSGHLLFKLILVDHKVKANLAYAVSCHTYHLPF